MKRLYTAEIIATGGRDGQVRSTDGSFNTDLRKPKELNGQGGAPNPEQLFAAAWGACYFSTLSSVAAQEGVDMTGAEVSVRISLHKNDNDFLLSAALDVHIPGIHIEEAQALADKANRACPYSKAVRGNIESSVIAL